jgi:hypothetical protein
LFLGQGVADIESNTAKEMTKLGAVIQVPFKAGNQFMGEGGLQVRIFPTALFDLLTTLELGRILHY